MSASAHDLLPRYRSGDHETVWREMRAHEAIDGEVRQEALAVAVETMRRVAANADIVAERLASRGWRALSGALRVTPSRQDLEAMDRFAAFLKAPLPPSLHAFWTQV